MPFETFVQVGCSLEDVVTFEGQMIKWSIVN